MNEIKLNELIYRFGGEQVDDDTAFDIADGILYDNPGLSEHIIKVKGIADPQGWLANQL